MSDLISDYWTNTPPIEGRPELNVDWNQIYLSERRTRLADSIDEYLQDDKTDARQTYEEILSCVQEVMNYHKKEYDKALELYNLMLGHRHWDPLECADSFASAE